MKTVKHFDWSNGFTIHKTLSRSFKTLDEAKRFADGKTNAEIYISKGLYKVQWSKTIDNN